jgi:hypothetical protein
MQLLYSGQCHNLQSCFSPTALQIFCKEFDSSSFVASWVSRLQSDYYLWKPLKKVYVKNQHFLQQFKAKWLIFQDKESNHISRNDF